MVNWWQQLSAAERELVLEKQEVRRLRTQSRPRNNIPNMPPAWDGIAFRLAARRRATQPNLHTHWYLSMVLAWIMWRDFGHVNEMQERGRVSGITLAAMLATDMCNRIYVPVPDIEEAFRQLSAAAEGGEVVGYIEAARPDDTIPMHLWPRLEGADDDYRIVQSRSRIDMRFDPVFVAEVAIQLWPPNTTPWRAPLPDAKASLRLSPPEQVIQDDSIEVVGRRIIELKQQNPNMTKDQIRTALGGMSNDRFSVVWACAREKYPDLQRGGRPRSQKKR